MSLSSLRVVRHRRSHGTRPGRHRLPPRVARAARRPVHPRQPRRPPPHDRGQPARSHERHRSLPRPAPGGGGDLVNLSSVAGRTARPGNAAYTATKCGLNGWSESLRQELQPDVRVIVIEPGAVATELTDHITHPGAKKAAEQMYQQLAITTEDIAEVIVFAVTRPRRMTLNEILVRPTTQS